MTLSRCANLTSTLRSLVVPHFLRFFSSISSLKPIHTLPLKTIPMETAHGVNLPRLTFDVIQVSAAPGICAVQQQHHIPLLGFRLYCVIFFFFPLALFSLPILFFFSATSPHPQSHCNSDDLMITHFRSEACMCSCKPLTPLTSMRSKHVQHRIVSFYMAGVVEASRR